MKPLENELNVFKLSKLYYPKDMKTGLEDQESSSKKEYFANNFW